MANDKNEKIIERILAAQSIDEIIALVKDMSPGERNSLGAVIAQQMDRIIGR